MQSNNIKVGAVIYDPKVTIIWNIITDFFKSEGLEMECLFYKDYDLQIDALMNREIDIAWNSPLAWLDAHLRTNGTCLLGSMRDTDQDRKTCLIVRKDSNIKSISDLKNKKIAFGALDSPQARMIPINFLHENGLEYKIDYQEEAHNIGLGLHGDHVGGELEAIKSLESGACDASFTLDLNWESWLRDGTVDKEKLSCLASTPYFDHCIFVAHPEFSKAEFQAWDAILNKMDYSNPKHREMMDMEGLKKWVSGRVSGFEQIKKANSYLNLLPFKAR